MVYQEIFEHNWDLHRFRQIAAEASNKQWVIFRQVVLAFTPLHIDLCHHLNCFSCSMVVCVCVCVCVCLLVLVLFLFFLHNFIYLNMDVVPYKVVKCLLTSLLVALMPVHLYWSFVLTCRQYVYMCLCCVYVSACVCMFEGVALSLHVYLFVYAYCCHLCPHDIRDR